jgi:hypothetical protein
VVLVLVVTTSILGPVLTERFVPALVKLDKEKESLGRLQSAA